MASQRRTSDLGILPPTTSPPFPLTSLPHDLLCEVNRHVSFPICLALRQTCRSFAHAFQPARLPAEEQQEFLRQAEGFGQNKGKLACLLCLKVRPARDFPVVQRTRKTPGRFCLACGAAGRLFAHLDGVRMKRRSRVRLRKGAVAFCCHVCGGVGSMGRRCRMRVVEREDEEEEVVVTECLPEGDVEAREPLGVGRARLECLPRDVQERVFGFLGYGDLIRMRQVSWWFWEAAEPGRKSLNEKFRFAREMELRVVASGRDPTARACYSCFRVRPEREFEKDGARQYELSERRKPHRAWKRRCASCLYRLYGPNADLEAAAEWRLRRFCPRCQGLYHHGQPCEGCEVLGPPPEEIVEDDDWSKLEPLLWSTKHVRHAVRIEPPRKRGTPALPPVPPEEELRGQGWYVHDRRDRRLRTTHTWKEEARYVRREWAARTRAAEREVGIFYDGAGTKQDRELVYQYYKGRPVFAWMGAQPPAHIVEAEKRLELEKQQWVVVDRISPLQILFGIDEQQHPYEHMINRLEKEEGEKGKGRALLSQRGFLPKSGSKPLRPIKIGIPGRYSLNSGSLLRLSQRPEWAADQPSEAAQQFGRELDMIFAGQSIDTTLTNSVLAITSAAPPIVSNARQQTPMVDTSWTARSRGLVTGLRNAIHRVAGSGSRRLQTSRFGLNGSPPWRP